jgi:hypothetical protein
MLDYKSIAILRWITNPALPQNFSITLITLVFSKIFLVFLRVLSALVVKNPSTF